MSRIAKLYPTRIYRTQHDPVIENESNMFTGIDSDTYATVTNNTNYGDCLFLGGFNFSLIPTQAIVSSFSIKICLGKSGATVYTNTPELLYNGTNVIRLTNQSRIRVYNTPTVSTIDATPLSFEDLRSYGDDFNIKVFTVIDDVTNVYGIEIDVEYDLPKNKVVYFGETLIDLTADTITPDKLTKGYTAHDASGAIITGTAQGGTVYQDSDGYVVLSEEGWDGVPTGNLTVTENGAYDVSDYAGVTVNFDGISGADLKAFIQRANTFTDIDWPDGITSIGAYAFAGCSYFNPTSLPNTVRTIGEHAFSDCSRLALTSLPAGVIGISPYAFQNCRQLALTSLPSGITYLNQYVFSNCTNLALTSLPDGLTTIGANVFTNCTNLALTSLPDSLTTISTSAFSGCEKLALTELPSGLTSIAGSAFNNCKKLAITEIPSGVTSLAGNAFTGCTSLQEISSEGIITTASYPVFTGTSTNPTMQLKSASFPNMAVNSSISYVFGHATADWACQQLAFCDIGSTYGIASNAFANCYALETLVLRKTAHVCNLGNVSAFLNTPMRGYNGKTGKVYVPSALISSYQMATNWATLYNDGTVEFLAIEGSEYER